MSVWQDYLLGLAYVYPNNEIQIEITDRVFGLLKILLYHAIKYEFGGWRVWIDTLSILHGRVTKEDYYRKINRMMETIKEDEDQEVKTTTSTPTASGTETPVDGQQAATPATPTREFFTLEYFFFQIFHHTKILICRINFESSIVQSSKSITTIYNF